MSYTMPFRDSIIRFRDYTQRKGLLHAASRALLTLVRYHPLVKYIIFSAELGPSPDPLDSNDSDEYTVHEKSALSDLVPSEVDALIAGHDVTTIRKKNSARFSKGAHLWLIKRDDTVFGFVWSLGAGTMKPYFFPLGKCDVYLFDNEIFYAYRGKGINRIFLKKVLNELKQHGFRRALIDTRIWDTPEIRCLTRIPFQPIAKARHIRLMGKVIVIWDSDRVMQT